MSGSALFLSPHLDDVAFSCGGTLIWLASEGWKVTLCTAFTRSVLPAIGFALACQLDKGLAADVDYMALRRAEDLDFARFAQLSECVHLPLPEAPHRGYESVADLFGGLHDDDRISEDLSRALAAFRNRFDWIFAPQGLGHHVDHLQMIRAVQQSDLGGEMIWYSDTPYAIRHPDAAPASTLPGGLTSIQLPVDVIRKVEGCALYRTQVPFQFGSAALLKEKLDAYHSGPDGSSERFLCSSAANTSPLQSRTIMRGN